MKLDRNLNADGGGKYALVNLRRYREAASHSDDVRMALNILDNFGVIDWGMMGEEDEFFVIKLKDKYAPIALIAYADAASKEDLEWGTEVMQLAERASQSPHVKKPD